MKKSSFLIVFHSIFRSTRFESNFAQNRRISLSVNYFFKTNLEWLHCLHITEYSMYLIEITTRIHSLWEFSKNIDSLLINYLMEYIQRTRSSKQCVLFHMSAKSNYSKQRKNKTTFFLHHQIAYQRSVYFAKIIKTTSNYRISTIEKIKKTTSGYQYCFG